jgi:pteridine reductase
MDISADESLQGVALVTGGARRLGAAIARELHRAGMNLAIHYRASGADARHLVKELNERRADSAIALRANLLALEQVQRLAGEAHARWGRLDALVNNASSYFRTPFGSIGEEQFEDLVGSNFKAPLFLAQACVPRFGERGAIVNLLDALARQARPGFAPYAAAKAALWSLTETLAVELAPRVRVNAVAPGHILWAEQHQLDAAQQQAQLGRVPLRRMGTPQDVARAVRLLLAPASAYLSGVVLPVDGALSLNASL